MYEPNIYYTNDRGEEIPAMLAPFILAGGPEAIEAHTARHNVCADQMREAAENGGNMSPDFKAGRHPWSYRIEAYRLAQA